MKRIPVAEPDVSGNELTYISKSIKTNWISSAGPFVNKFEKSFASFIGTRYAISTSSGTAALHLSLAGLGIGKGDEVIVPNLTFVATANAVTYTKATPVLTDVTNDTWTIDPEKVKSDLTKRTKAIIAVHLYGHPVEMKKLRQIASTYNLYLIEDAAEAIGTKYRGKLVGNMGDIGCFSFYGNKTITTGEGGMITTNNKRLYNKISLLNNHGMSSKKRYYHTVLGFNYKMTNLQAAIGLAQLERKDSFIEKKRIIASTYNSHLKELQEYITLPPEQPWAFNTYWMYSIIVKPSIKKNRNHLMNFLSNKNIESRPFFTALNQLPMYKHKASFPVSTYLARNGMSLPSGTKLNKNQISFICRVIKRFFTS